MHDFPSEAFGRPVNLQELSFWPQVDLQTLRSELRARLKEINFKIEHHKNRGIFNKRELNARTYLQVFHNKAYEELQNRWEDQRRDKLEKELQTARRQLKEEIGCPQRRPPDPSIPHAQVPNFARRTVRQRRNSRDCGRDQPPYG